MSYIEVRFTLEQWDALNKQIEENYNTHARIIADAKSSVIETHRESYKLWRSIDNAMISGSEWREN